MRRGLLHVLAWLLATGAAVTLSWWGVHTVLAGTAYDPPRALPITASPTPSAPSKSAKPSPGPTPGAPVDSDAPGDSADSGEVKSYDTEGGRVVFSLSDTYATLVSATPGSGWSMRVWKTETWIRVEFAVGADRVTVFCTWHDSAPRVDVQNY
ncbi:hypothetical protein [Streptomyces ipomoeae]|nr:hypothetical protein [Streptomyces ipomoeae]